MTKKPIYFTWPGFIIFSFMSAMFWNSIYGLMKAGWELFKVWYIGSV